MKRLPSRLKRLTREPTPGRPVKMLIVGVPNVGKSTLMNTLKGRRIARVGDEAAITKGQQTVDLSPGVRLVDTPGLLWPRLDDERRALLLAATGAIRDDQVDEVEVAIFTVSLLAKDYPKRLAERYKVDAAGVESHDLLAEIGRRRGCLVSGGEVDLMKAGRVLLGDLRGGRLGRVSLERPESS